MEIYSPFEDPVIKKIDTFVGVTILKEYTVELWLIWDM